MFTTEPRAFHSPEKFPASLGTRLTPHPKSKAILQVTGSWADEEFPGHKVIPPTEEWGYTKRASSRQRRCGGMQYVLYYPWGMQLP